MEETVNSQNAANSTQGTTGILRRLARWWSAAVLITTVFVLIQNLREPQQYLSNTRAETSVVTLVLLVSVLGLAFALRWERLGAIVNLVFFVLAVLLYWIINGEFLRFGSLALMALLIVPGILFLVSAQGEPTP